jgi:hypothetical protein
MLTRFVHLSPSIAKLSRDLPALVATTDTLSPTDRVSFPLARFSRLMPAARNGTGLLKNVWPAPTTGST